VTPATLTIRYIQTNFGYLPFLFLNELVKDKRTDGRTDGQTDGHSGRTTNAAMSP